MRGIAYGMPTIRVDGNDIFAIYVACKKAREIIINEKRPVLIEAISYRVGDHSTSDYSQRYRDEKEMLKWKELLTKFSSPIQRFEKYMLKRGLIKEGDSQMIREEAKESVRDALKNSMGVIKPSIDEMFTDVYDELPQSLKDQKQELKHHLQKYKDEYDLHTFKDGKDVPHSN